MKWYVATCSLYTYRVASDITSFFCTQRLNVQSMVPRIITTHSEFSFLRNK